MSETKQTSPSGPPIARQGPVHTSNWRWGPEATLRNPLVVSDFASGRLLAAIETFEPGPSRLHLVTLSLDCQRLPEDACQRLGLFSPTLLQPRASLYRPDEDIEDSPQRLWLELATSGPPNGKHPGRTHDRSEWMSPNLGWLGLASPYG